MANGSGTTTNGHERFRNWGPWIGFSLAILAAGGLLSAGLGWIILPLFTASGLVGWIGGIVLSPTNPSEKKLFSDFGKGVATLVTGFLIGKLDRLFELAFGQGTKINIEFVSYAGVFIGALCLGGLSTFIWRTYVSKPSDAETLIAEAITMLKNQAKKPSAQVEKASGQLTHTIEDLRKAPA